MVAKKPEQSPELTLHSPYDIIIRASPNDLVEAMNQAVSQGYTPLGGIAVAGAMLKKSPLDPVAQAGHIFCQAVLDMKWAGTASDAVNEAEAEPKPFDLHLVDHGKKE